jgi:hypothetical protein
MSTAPGAGGIAHGLQQNIRGRVLALGQPGFSAAAHLFNPRFDHTVPSAVARPIDAVDVRDAVRYLVSKADGGSVRRTQLRRILHDRQRRCARPAPAQRDHRLTPPPGP